MGGGQRLQIVGIEPVVLDKDQVPKLQVAFAIAVYAANVPGHVLFIAKFRPEVDVDLAARPTGTGISHFPKVLFAAKIEDMFRFYTGLLDPVFISLSIGGDIALVVFEAGSI